MSKSKTPAPRVMYARGILTLDLPTAREPVIWRQEFKKVSNLSFSLHPVPEGGDALVLRVADGAEQIIASFDNPAAAQDSLAVLRDLLMRKRRSVWFYPLWVIKWLAILMLLYIAGALALQGYMNIVAQRVAIQIEKQQVAPPPQTPAPAANIAPAAPVPPESAAPTPEPQSSAAPAPAQPSTPAPEGAAAGH